MSTTADTSHDNGVWMYAVVGEAGLGNLAATTAIAGNPVRTVAAAGIAAVVSDVPLADYADEALRRNLEDLAWLEQTARKHHAVVDLLSRSVPVVPARLATIYRDDDGVIRALNERREELTAALERLAGREEWGVKGYAAPTDTGTTDVDTGQAGGTGTAYLRRRKAQLTAQQQGQQAAAEAAEAVHDKLSGYAVAASRHAPQDRRLTHASTPMVLNGAYLIDEAAVPGFSALVDELAHRHPAIRLELTGPWPPYSFAADGPAPTQSDVGAHAAE